MKNHFSSSAKKKGSSNYKSKTTKNKHQSDTVSDFESSSEEVEKKRKDKPKKTSNIKKESSSKKNPKQEKNGKSKKHVKGDTNHEIEEENENNLEDDLESLLLPGQKFPTPPQGDASRAFYESLLEQKPESMMALRWCIEYGCLESDRVIKFKKIFNRQLRVFCK